MAFNYSIYKNNKKIYTSEYIEPNEIKANDIITLDTNTYQDGVYIIELTVYDNSNNIVSKKSKEIRIGKDEITIFKVKDYVKMMPSSNSYIITKSKTGYGKNQTINPKELNLWRVIRVNDDNTVDMVSEYASSENIFLSGKKGYQNSVGVLNLIAKQYENSKYTIGSRHMGYNGQTEYIDDAYFTTTVPQQARTMIDNVTKETEKKGLGDFWYETDYNLVKEACGDITAYKPNTTTLPERGYWLASREYKYYSDVQWEYGVHTLYGGGEDKGAGYNPMYEYYKVYRETAELKMKEWSSAIRPIVTLKSGLKASSGNGSNSSPYILD